LTETTESKHIPRPKNNNFNLRSWSTNSQFV